MNSSNYHEKDLWVEKLHAEKARKDKQDEEYDSLLPYRVRPQAVMRELERILPQDALIVAETGYAFWWSATLLKINKPRSYLSPSGNSTLGFRVSCGSGGKVRAA